MDYKVRDAVSEFHILRAVLEWESEEGLTTEVGMGNLAHMDAPTFNILSETGGKPERFDEVVWREILGKFRDKFSGYIASGVDAAVLADRMNTVVRGFRTFGYRDYFAGQEGSIRARLFDATNTTRASELAEVNIHEPKLQKLAAYYMAYTDFLP